MTEIGTAYKTAIESAMEQQGISIKEIGKKLHKNAKSIANWISDIDHTPIDKIYRICKVLDIDPIRITYNY